VFDAVSFLTVLGRGGRPRPSTLRWFPVVGAGLGLLLGAVWWGASRVWPPAVAAAVVVAADLALTGLLHLDGLADSADGLLPHLSQQRRLEVMRTPDVGAFGMGASAATLLARWAALSVLAPAPLLLGGLWCASRSAMAAVPGRLRYARGEEGLAAAFTGVAVPVGLLGLALAASLALATGWRVVAGPASVAAAAAGFAAVVGLAVRRVGGFTGDVLGAAGLIAETVGLMVAAARW